VLPSLRQSAPLHVVPPTKSASGSAPSVSLSTTANSHGLHDTLRHGGGRSLVNEIKKDDFKTRLEQVRRRLAPVLACSSSVAAELLLGSATPLEESPSVQ
jgi:hypothetical protein